ncbi:MAG: hypothetical protein HQK76_19970 [Desulfobacterales bacterium]|nr:hypothetical protein [Desulfobacterales bacterium]
MYEFVSGPLALTSFAIFFVGLIIRTVYYIKGLDWKLDRVAYREYPEYGFRGAVRSIILWLVPFGTRSWKANPLFTITFFLFHLGVVITPIFLSAHNILLKEKLGIGLFSIPNGMADFLTVAVIVCAVFLILRRIGLPEVRILTTVYDYILLGITVMPFITGFIAFHQVSDYKFWLIIHIICGEIMLVAIPFTKLSHFVLFFLSRAQIGMDFGIKRGGMKNKKGMAW